MCENITSLYDCMNVCEQWFPIQPFQCFEQCTERSTDKQTISILRKELQETIKELNDVMNRLTQVTDELKETDNYKDQIQKLSEENKRLQERIKKLEGTFHSTDTMNITLPVLIPRIPANA